MRSSRHRQNGSTCIEIMVVILVAGLLATIVIQHLPGAADKAKRAKAQADIAELKTALDRYYLDNGYYPTTDQGLRALVTPPTNGFIPLVYYTGGYIERLPRDPWGNPYFYQSDGNSYVLKSLGPDGVESADDIDGSQSQ
ncbi:type II secretion system major pseudopilin GspG [Candidatus Binatus sp.]|uniref:type II secretion system major pseudopilin GspG n=1 Tax=Candidatus Binatus sp. TaxID=2811406 RepID=UPI003BB0ECA1